ncbi:MAG: TetR/AcrR family transcriptional regulator, partial [Actinomycetales bacterium]
MAGQVRDRLLMSAIRIGQRDGWSRLTVADVLEESGAARRSFYTHFPAGTSEITVAAVTLAADWISGIVEQASELPTPAALSSFVEHWTTMLEGSGFTLGCPVAAAAASRPQHPEAADVAEAAFSRWESSIAAALTRDGVGADEAQRLAVVVVACVEGA